MFSSDVVKVQVLLLDLGDFQAMNEVFEKVFGGEGKVIFEIKIQSFREKMFFVR